MTLDYKSEKEIRGLDSFEEAIKQWLALLGPERVLVDNDKLDFYSKSTSSYGTRPLAILCPHTTEEVCAVVKIASAAQISLYPISGGKNWGYGDACAVLDGQVIVDLSSMNRILEVDDTLAYAVIEPGVTQKQLSEYLREHNIPLWMDCTGAGPDTSLVGNIMERGFGHSPYGNRFQTIAGLQIVLANGQILNTGFGHYSKARTTYLFPYGIGPYLDGLFTQSNFGIVTRLGLWLMPAFNCVNHFLCLIKEHEDIQPAIDSLRSLRLDGTLRSIIHIGNDLRLISGNSSYPLDRSGALVPLPIAMRQKLRQQTGVGAWNISGAIYGSPVQVAISRCIIKKTLKGKGRKLIFLDERKLLFGGFLARLFGNSQCGRNLKNKLETIRALFDMNRGIPNGRFLTGAYWRRQGGLPPHFPRNANPTIDNCGLLWLSPVIPMRGADVLKLHEIVEPLFQQYGFDLFITLSTVNDRALGAVITIAYDKENIDERKRAQKCYQVSFKAVMEAGFIPYRVGIQSMQELANGSQVFWEAVDAVKSALDPNNIIAPGRYEPGRAKYQKFVSEK